MVVYRLSKEEYARKLNGMGAAMFGGRWNKKGSELIYGAQHRSLALCEFLVHLPASFKVQNILMLEIELGIETIPTLKIGSSDLRNLNKTQNMGEEFISAKKHLAVAIPSVIIPEESNIIINPSHPSFSKVKIIKRTPFFIDQRFLQK